MNRKIDGFSYLEKDPNNGAVLLSQNQSIEILKLDNLMRKLKVVEKQNDEILQLLKTLAHK